MILCGREITTISQLFVIAGPCVIESEEHSLRVSATLAEIAERLGVLLPLAASGPHAQEGRGDEVPVTIEELDVEDAIREFQQFKDRLGNFREEIGEGREIAKETSQILADLRASAGPENDFNERQILEAGLRRFGGNKARLCEELKVPKTTLYAKLKRYGLVGD